MEVSLYNPLFTYRKKKEVRTMRTFSWNLISLDSGNNYLIQEPLCFAEMLYNDE